MHLTSVLAGDAGPKAWTMHVAYRLLQVLAICMLCPLSLALNTHFSHAKKLLHSFGLPTMPRWRFTSSLKRAGEQSADAAERELCSGAC